MLACIALTPAAELPLAISHAQPTLSTCCHRRAAEATAEELATLQERALWDLLALFWVERPGAAGGQGLVAQVRACVALRSAVRPAAVQQALLGDVLVKTFSLLIAQWPLLVYCS